MLSEMEHDRYYGGTLEKQISHASTNMEAIVDLSETLLCSSLSCLRAVKSANDRHTDY